MTRVAIIERIGCKLFRAYLERKPGVEAGARIVLVSAVANVGRLR